MSRKERDGWCGYEREFGGEESCWIPKDVVVYWRGEDADAAAAVTNSNK